MKKKLTGSLIASMVFVLMFGSSFAFASDPSGWQKIDTASWQYAYTGYQTLNGAEGGNAKICLEQAPGSGITATILEDDGSSNYQIYKGYFNVGSCWTFDVNPYVDGLDNDAEFLINITRTLNGDVRFALYD